jgi:hypothetical protein
VVGALVLYVLLRGPWLLIHAGRIRQRWRRLQDYRRELAAWSVEQREKAPRDGP